MFEELAMTVPNDVATLLPATLPACDNRRLLLYVFRRVAAHGLNDAHGAHAMLTVFGRSYRRPLVLVRALAAEMSRVSARRLMVAPCCCPRMTAAEATLLDTLTIASTDPQGAHDALARLLGVHECIGALGSAQALAQAFADLGRPID
jgi:hypothetical protein